MSQSIKRKGRKKIQKSVSSDDSFSDSSVGESSRKAPIPGATLKQLAEDIERAGGIKSFDKGLKQGLNILLDYRTYDEDDPECYGERGSSLRGRIRKKVAYWKKLPSEHYVTTLGKLGVLPASHRSKEEVSQVTESAKKPGRSRKKNRDTTRVVPPEVVEVSEVDTEAEVNRLSAAGRSPLHPDLVPVSTQRKEKMNIIPTKVTKTKGTYLPDLIVPMN